MTRLYGAVRGAGVLAITAILLNSAVPSGAGEWNLSVIDSAGMGLYSSLKFDQKGNAHIAYVVEDEHYSLKYAFWDHVAQKWFTMTVAQGAAFCSLAVDSNQKPHISYVDRGATKDSRIRYAHWDGTSWQQTIIPVKDGVAYYTSIALDKNDFPQISFFDNLSPDGSGVLRLKVLSWNGKYWGLRTVDGEPGTGPLNALTLDTAGHSHIAYASFAKDHAGLRYAYSDGEKWTTEIVDEMAAGKIRYISSLEIALDRENRPRIAYTDAANQAVKYAVRVDGKWQIQVAARVAGSASTDRSGIVVDDGGNPYISFYDAGLGALKVAALKDNKWTIDTVEENSSGFSSSLQLAHDKLWVTYAAEKDGNLKIASKDLRQASGGQ